MSILACRRVGKVFRQGKERITALEEVSFSLEKGSLTGLMGPDGAGKSTLLRILVGLLKPTEGNAHVMGWDTVRDAKAIQSHIGYMPQKYGLYENMSVRENLELYSVLRGVAVREREKRFSMLLKMSRLEAFSTRMTGMLSGGMKQKLALACALVSTPELILLDEPTVGVDVLSRREIWELLRQVAAEEKTTILASTAYMDEADYCDRTLILFQGRLIADDTPTGIHTLAAQLVEKPTFEHGFQVLLTGAVEAPIQRRNPPSSAAPVLVHAERLVKRFGAFTAVSDISFDVRKGEIFGLLGGNGAGKTTTFRMLCGLSEADEGTVEIAGLNLRRASGNARRKIGFVAQKFSLYTNLSVRTNLQFYGGAYGLYGKKLRDRIAWGVETFGLEPYWKFPAAKLPMGFQQRLSMACALLHEPEILFLDEATSGADPLTRREFWRRILELADSGVAVIITTHFLDEANYCDRMLIMQDGKSAASGSVSEIKKQGTLSGKEPETLEDAFVNILQANKANIENKHFHFQSDKLENSRNATHDREQSRC